MPNPPLIIQPFAAGASGGDIALPPQTDPSGFVNFTQGYTSFYEIDLSSGNPQAKAVERNMQNGLFNLMTANEQAWQQYSYPPWFASMPNGYDVNACVIRLKGAVWTPYRSLVANNITDPLTSPASWEYIPFGHEIQQGISNFSIDSGALNAMVGSYVPTITTRAEGMLIRIKPAYTNNGALTINDGAGIVPVVGRNHQPCTGGEAQANGEMTLEWNSSIGTGGSYAIVSSSGADQLPINSYAVTPPVGDQTTKLANQSSVFSLKNGLVTVPLSNANVILTPAQYGVGIILFTGAITANITVYVPQQSGDWVFANNTTGAFSVTISTQATGTPKTALVPQTQSVVAYCDGTNVILAGAAATSSFTRYTFTATAGQTKFPAPYTPGNTIFVINGSDLAPSNYTATDGANHVVGASYNNGNGCFVNDDVQIIAFASFTVANAITPLGGTMTGPLMLVGGDTCVAPPQFDNTTKIVSSAFVNTNRGGFNGFSGVSGATTLTLSQLGSDLLCLSYGTPFTITFPVPTGVPVGTNTRILNLSGVTATIQMGAGCTLAGPFNASGSATSFTIPSGSAVDIVYEGSNQFNVSGDGQIASSFLFSSSLAGNGYQKLPSGLIIQWGIILTNSSGTAALVWPIAYPTGAATFVCSPATGTPVTSICGGSGLTKTGITVYANTVSGTLISDNVQWMVVGY